MSAPFDVAVIVGSLRKDSLNRQVASALMKLAPPALKMRFVEIGDLPLYNQDHDAAPPAAWTRFRDAVKAADAVLFVTPEYNRSVPGVLKNAIDVGSRPAGHGALLHKPAAVASASPGALGGFGACHHLRQSAVFLDMPMLAQPEMYLSRAPALFEANGDLANDDTKELFKRFLDAFAAWIERNAG